MLCTCVLSCFYNMTLLPILMQFNRIMSPKGEFYRTLMFFLFVCAGVWCTVVTGGSSSSETTTTQHHRSSGYLGSINGKASSCG